MLYFIDRNTVSAECYTTSDGRRIYVSGEDRPGHWNNDYVFVPSDPKGHWDNKATTAKNKSGRGGKKATSDSGKTPCEDASLFCEICDQKGFPILPLRYAVARSDVSPRAPALQAQFGAGVSDIPLPGKDAQYTLRLLRPGYLYAFNEKRGEWKGYVVSDGGFLLEYDMESTPPNVGDAKPCARMAASAAARCVMIPDADKAGRVWLGFSDTAWTQSVWDNNRREDYRKRHMQCVDIGAWLKGTTGQDHAAAIDRIVTLVSEFAQPVPAGQYEKPVIFPPLQAVLSDIRDRLSNPAFAHSLQKFHNASGSSQDLIAATTRAVERLPNKGPAMMLALNDPVGITMELARLPALRLEAFTRSVGARPLAVSTAIEDLRNAIMDDAENREIYRTERDAREVLDPGYMAGDGGGGARGGQAIADWLFPEQAKAREELFERWRNPAAAQLKAARHDAWAKYAKKYRETQRATWRNQWDAKSKAFDQAVVEPLVQAHVAWMRSKALLEHCNCNHDDKDVHSGQGFVDALVLCIQDTQQFVPCSKLYAQWLGATMITPDNLLLRGVSYDQKKIIDQINGFASGGLQPESLKGLPWDGLINGYSEALEALADGSKNAVVRLLAALGGPIADLAGKAVDGVIGPGLVALGAIAKAPVVMVDVVMSKSDAIAELTARMTAMNPKVGDLKSLNRAIDIQLRKAKIYGTPVAGTGRFRYLLMFDPQVVEDFPGVNVAGNPTGRRFAESAILSEADRARLTKLRWNKLLPGAAGLGIVTGILQTVALGKLADDLDKSMAHEANENTWRYRSTVAALAGTLAETTGKWTESAVTAGNRLARFMERHVSKVLRIGGKALGIGVGVVMAVWDFWRGTEEIHEGNVGVGWLYVGSAVAGVGAMVAFSALGSLLFGAAATGVGIVLVVLVIVIAVLIEVFKDNKVQDWLERCYFGKFDKSDRYQDGDLEARELKIAVAG